MSCQHRFNSDYFCFLCGVTASELRRLYEQELDVIGPTPGPFTHHVIAEVMPGIARKLQQRAWLCERHPERPWPHDDCPGPGMS